MLPFDRPPELGPLRPTSDVLPLVMVRGRMLRRRRRVALAAPVVGLVTVGVLALSLGPGSLLSQRVRTVPAAPPPNTPTTAATTLATLVGGGTVSEAPNATAAARASGGPETSPGAVARRTTSAQAQAPTVCPAPPPGPAANQPQYRYDCWPTGDGPGGNYTGNDPTARGCVVHNAGGQIANQNLPSQFFCSYDAIAAGGYTSNGPFNQLRITRNGHTIFIDGFKAPRCEPTGFILPGDHVYIDGRNNFSTQPNPTTAQYTYTTTSVGDPFHC